MHWIDISILVILLLSTLIAVVRGFIKEAISLATWIAAFFISISFSPKLVSIFPDVISAPLLRQGLAWFLLFIATMLVGGLISFIVNSMVNKTGLSHTNRALGTLFGLARGVVIICVLVLLGVYMELPKTDWWMQAKLLLYFQYLTELTVSLIPDDIINKLIFK